MTVQACLKDQIGRLVHPSVQGTPAAALHHLLFIAGAFVVSGLALAATPLVLASGHVPSWRDAAMLFWLLLPLLAAARVSNTGELGAGQTLMAVGWIGAAWTGLASGVCGAGVAMALLLLVLVETVFPADTRTSIVLRTLALVSAAAILMFAEVHPSASLGQADLPLAALALVQGAAVALRGWSAARVAADAEARDDVDGFRAELLDGAGDLLLRFDRGGAVLAGGNAAERVLGMPASELTGRGFFDRVHVADRPAFLHAVNQAVTADSPAAVSLRFRIANTPSPNGAYAEQVFAVLDLRIHATEAGPKSDAVVAVVHNITERVQHEAEMERTRRQIEQANAAKDRFIATVSHELRTPLNSIIGFAEMLASPVLAPQEPAKRQEYADIIRSSGQHLLAVVNSLLDLSKLDAGKFEICCEPFDVAELVQSCCDMVSLKADEDRITLRHDIPPGLEPLLADRRACKQILLNLLSNALKFTRAAGRVTVAVRPDGNALLLAVADNGIGMAPRDLAKLGDPFFQARGDYDRPFEGTGLGLSVVKGLVGLHGGTITVDSAPGEGTTVTVRLPLDGRRPLRMPSARIEVITRTPRLPAAPSPDHKAQKIA